jgi:hypothetical protein
MLFFFIVSSRTFCASSLEGISFLNKAFAPNVNGQDAYSLKLTYSTQEFGVFANSDLQAGSSSLVGASWLRRFSLCTAACSFSHAILLGGGISSAGPLFEISWSFQLLWLLRVDFTTHYFVSTTRLVNWSYPLWLGLTIPL